VDRGIAEGTSISVRGLRQNVYLFNGRQIVDPTGRGGYRARYARQFHLRLVVTGTV